MGDPSVGPSSPPAPCAGDEDPYRRLQQTLAGLPPGMKIRIPKVELPRAPYPTWRRSVGYHVRGASLRQYRDGCVHVHETATEWIVHRDRVSPHENLLAHLYRDCRGAFWTSSLLSGATVAALAARALARARAPEPWLKRIAGAPLQWKRR